MGRGMAGGGPERVVLSLALLVPLVVASVSIGQLATTGFAGPSTLMKAGTVNELNLKRPIDSQSQVPPTLAAPTATPVPTATPAPSPHPLDKASPRGRGEITPRWSGCRRGHSRRKRCPSRRRRRLT